MKRRLLVLAAALAAVGALAGAASAAISLGISPNPVAPGQTVTFSGTTDDGAGLVGLILFTGSDCESPFGLIGITGTDEGGSYTYTASVSSDFPLGTYSVMAISGEESEVCEPLTIGFGSSVAPPPPPDGIFLCYSTSQSQPGVWPADVAAGLLKQGYWLPFAVPNNVAGGTNIGGFHLECNLAATQSVSSDFVGGDGTVLGSAYKGVPGLYPKVG